MKLVFKLIPAVALLFTAIQSSAQEDDHKKDTKRYANYKERNISKTYSASGNSLSIDNSFGDVKIITWDKNEIKVDIHIEASSDDKEYAEQVFNGISVVDNQSGNKISFKTEHKDNKKECKNCHSNMSTDYEIHMPANNTLDIDNSFGDIIVPDYNGTISLQSKFGSLTAGKLAKTEKLWVEFGHADIKSASNVEATFKFSRINLEQLGGSNKIDMEFSSFSKVSLGSDLTSLRINESYSTVNIRPAAGLSATYNISTSFGTVVDRANIGIKRTDEPDRYGPDSEKTYEGKSGSGAAKIEVKSSFGKIIIGDASAEEMRDKEKKKEKTTRV